MSTLHPSRHLGSAACSGHTDSDCRSSTSGGSREWHRRHGITSDSNDSRCSRMDTKTTPGRPGARVDAPVRVASRVRYHVSTQDEFSFVVRWLAYAFPCRRFANALAGACAWLGADAGRYSFIVGDYHHLLLAGLPGAHRIKSQPCGV